MTVMQSRPIAKRADSRDVVGMKMRVDRLDEPQIQLIQQLDVAINPLQDGIDDEGFATPPTGQQITVGGRHIVEHLAENHVGRPSLPSRSPGSFSSSQAFYLGCWTTRK